MPTIRHMIFLASPAPPEGGGEGPPSPEAHDIPWANLSNAVIGLGNIYTATAGASWGNGGSSSESISGDGWVQKVVTETTGSGDNFPRINHGLFVSGTTAQVYESGSGGASTTISPGSLLRVERQGPAILYLKDGVAFYTNPAGSADVLYANATAGNPGDDIENLILSGSFS